MSADGARHRSAEPAMTNPAAPRSTSERLVVDDIPAGRDDYLIYLIHIATYEFARSLVTDRRVMDFGCGTGYGTHRLSGDSASIVGVDVSDNAIRFAANRYKAPNLTFQSISPIEAAPLPFQDGSFDIVLSFQVIEHVPDPGRYIAEVVRVLADGGVLVMATPDRSSRLLARQRPWNRYHRVEYDRAGLAQLLRTHFGQVEVNSMSGERDLINGEVRRTHRLRWATLPFTFPGAPEFWRQAGLAGLDRAKSAVGRSRGKSGSPVSGAQASAPYDESALRIGQNLQPSVTLVAVARAPRRLLPDGRSRDPGE
jgi:SAM-dependent methyltransferase